MRYVAELELIFHKADGLSFQYFFNDLMSRGILGFCPVRQQKDGGNDGFVQGTGTFYQVYSPQSITSSTIQTASSKMIEDFDKLAKNWHYLIPLKEYVFVFNDKFQGADSSIIRRVTKLGLDRELKTTILTARDLEEIFYSLTPVQQDLLIAKHSTGRMSSPAIKFASDLISTKLSIEKWNDLDEQLSFSCLYETDLNILSEIRSELFSMDFPEHETQLISDLYKSMSSLVDLFYSEYTTDRNGERKWDNSWKRTDNHPNARVFDMELEKWERAIQEHTIKLAEQLNKFAKHVRERIAPDFLGYKNYTITRRYKNSTQEHIQIIP